LIYAEGPSPSADRPPFVLAASGLASLGKSLFVVQDNANWLAIVSPDATVVAVPLPRSAHGERVFSKDRHNTQEKVDLEACVVMGGEHAPELVAFGSGTGESSGWILRLDRPDRLASSRGGDSAQAHPRFCNAGRFYEALRADRRFSGGRLNIEGAVALDTDRILILQRGNAPPGEGEAVDATGVISWKCLRAHLDDPSSAAPAIEKVTRYELGELDGVRLTFSDAELLGDGRILYSASAENVEDGQVAGSVLGLIEKSGEARWGRILCEDGTPFTSKIEGLTLTAGEPHMVRFVIDDDDETSPSQIFEAELSDAFDLA
jgi:hypothetical protein